MSEAGYFYLASPYTHEDQTVMVRRYEWVRDVAAFLSRSGLYCFSPIAHSHDMAIANRMPTNFEFWDDWNRCMIRGSCGIIVLKMQGWELSKGVKAEIAYAREISKPVLYMGDPNDQHV